jgi:hypothetical protein
MLLTTVLLTPMILAAEPVRLEVPEQSYDHRTQTSTIKGSAEKRLKMAYSSTNTWLPTGSCRPGSCSDSDSD